MRRAPAHLVVAVACAVAGYGKVARADFFFGEATNLGPTVNSSSYDHDPRISPDGLELYFTSTRPGGQGSYDVWVATRESTRNSWGAPVNLRQPVNKSGVDGVAGISADGLELYLISIRTGGSGSADMWLTRRASVSEPWGEPVNLGPTVNSSSFDAGVISPDGLSLVMNSDRPGGSGSQDLWISTRSALSDPWGTPVNFGPTVNSPGWDFAPAFSFDGQFLLFTSTQAGGYGDWDIWMMRRITPDSDWGAPMNAGPQVNSSPDQGNASISADGSMFYFGSVRDGGIGDNDLWQMPILPVVDLNGDGFVDAGDMRVVVNHWGQDYGLCDIGPMPWGDGVVDVKDLIVLSEHLFEQASDPALVAHWALDETAGMVVADSAGGNNGYALGNPVWLPDGGQVNGALEFDGVDDFISAAAPLNPAEGPFSVFVWIKGGAAGQGIISEPGGSYWLSLDPQAGHLMTELTGDGNPLLSETTVTDGNWHRIGFVWDGSYRTLVVDGNVVAEDAQNRLESPANSFYIGCGDPVQASSFFSGLIDDVRVYSRAMRP